MEVLIKQSFTIIKLQLNGIQLNKEFQNQAKQTTLKLLQGRDVVVHIQNFDKVINYFYGSVQHPKGDISEVLLKEGFVQLTREASQQSAEDPYFQKLRLAMRQAQDQSVGMWTKADTFIGLVLEVNSGDSITVQDKKGGVQKLYLSGIRIPSKDQPYAFECKECLRKFCIGKQVKVEHEYKKETPSMQFASILIDNENASIHLVKSGLAMVSEAYSCKYISDLQAAEFTASKQKLNLFSSRDPPKAYFSDLTGKENLQMAKGMAHSIIQEHLPGVVEYVFNAGRYKVRLPESIIVLNLQGITVPVADKNIEWQDKMAAQATKYCKMQYQQRDFTVVISKLHEKSGCFIGKLLFNGNDVALDLLRKGYAYNKENIKYDYKAAEQDAINNKRGVWQNQQEESKGQEPKLVKQQIEQEVQILEVIDANEFYVIQAKNKAKQEEFVQQINQMDLHTIPNLEEPIRNDTPCLAQFSVDGLWYRAKIVRRSKTTFKVWFIDYGNYEDELQLKHLKKLPPSIAQIPQMAEQYRLAFVRIPNINEDWGLEAAERLKDLGLGKTLNMKIIDKDNVELFDPQVQPPQSFNLIFVQEGLGRLHPNAKVHQSYTSAEINARTKNKGIWSTGDLSD